mgnify:CR=1 FL=1|tara:strand:- start:469 stop:735 length:267 start_codon:yes stop_codon:yes gene_type:complete
MANRTNNEMKIANFVQIEFESATSSQIDEMEELLKAELGDDFYLTTTKEGVSFATRLTVFEGFVNIYNAFDDFEKLQQVITKLQSITA